MTERLLKLADYLDTCPPERWNFNHFFKITDCGTVGCALGQMANAFPEDWVNGGIGPVLREFPTYNLWLTCVKYLGIGDEDADRLFFSNDIYGVSHSQVTPQMVAIEIRRYVNDKDR